MNPPSTAPKKGSFLGDFGYPWLLMTMWNEPSMKWVVADPQVGIYEKECNDTYFENEMHPEKDLLGWIPVPTKPTES